MLRVNKNIQLQILTITLKNTPWNRPYEMKKVNGVKVYWDFNLQIQIKKSLFSKINSLAAAGSTKDPGTVKQQCSNPLCSYKYLLKRNNFAVVLFTCPILAGMSVDNRNTSKTNKLALE